MFSRFIYQGAVFDSNRVSGQSVSVWMLSGSILSSGQCLVAAVGRLLILIFLGSPPAQGTQDGSNSYLQLLCYGK